MKKYWRLYKMFFKINVMKDLAYRGNFLVGIILVSFESLIVIMLVKIIFSYVGNIAGWYFDDMLVLSGIYMFTISLAWLTYKGGIVDLDQVINRGDMDWMIVKPIDTQFISTFHRIDLEDGARSLVGIVVIVIGLQNSEIFKTLLSLPLFLITFLAGQVVLYSFHLLLKTISFKSIQGWATNSIPWRFNELAQYPTDIYRGIMRVLYLYILPLAFVATVPAKALTGKLSWQLLVGSIIAAILSFIISRLVWKRALKSYSSASS